VQRAVETLFSETARKLASNLLELAERHVAERITQEEATA